jgi:hypothetical protein
MRPVPRIGPANPAAIAALAAERICSQMAPQRLEKIESAPGNGMAPEPRTPNIWYKSASDGSPSTLSSPSRTTNATRGRRGTEIFLAAKPWKVTKCGKDLTRAGSWNYALEKPAMKTALQVRGSAEIDGLEQATPPRPDRSVAPRGPRRAPANADAAKGEEN